MILPKLATGFQNGKGDIFGFGDYEESSEMSVANMDSQKLEKAPVHNLVAECSVGFMNYELSIRGAKQSTSASSAQVKAKSTDLIDRQQPGSFKKYSNVVRKGGRITEIILTWNKQQ